MELDIDLIIEEFNYQLSVLNDDIEHIDRKLVEIQKYITMLDSINKKMEKDYMNETDPKMKVVIFKNIKDNISRICELQDVYNKYLSVKYSFRQNQSYMIYNKNKLMVDIIFKQEEADRNIPISEFLKLMVPQSNPVGEDVTIDGDEYKLD